MLDKIMYSQATTTSIAKSISKAAYDYHCIVTGMHSRDIIADGGRFDGCHIYDAGNPNYGKLKNLPLNIIPLRGSRHTSGHDTFDYVKYYSEKRKPHEKIEWIVQHVLPEFRQQLLLQIEELEIIREQLVNGIHS